MLESGPLRMKEGILRVVEGGWEEYTTIVFGASPQRMLSDAQNSLCAVDQPPGTGYSYTSTNRYVHELTEVSEAFVAPFVILNPSRGCPPTNGIHEEFLQDFPRIPGNGCRLLSCVLTHAD